MWALVSEAEVSDTSLHFLTLTKKPPKTHEGEKCQQKPVMRVQHKKGRTSVKCALLFILRSSKLTKRNRCFHIHKMIGFFYHARSTWKLKQIFLLTWSIDRIFFALVYAVEMWNQGMVLKKLFKWNLRGCWAHRNQEKYRNNFKDFRPVVHSMFVPMFSF